MQQRQTIASALLACRDANLAPMVEAFFGALIRNTCAARAGDGLYRGYAKLDGLLYDVIHTVCRR